MKNFLPIFLICALLIPARAKQNQTQNPVLNTWEQELKREFKQLKKAKPPVYFLSYQITEHDNFYDDKEINNKLMEYLIWYNTKTAHQGLNWQTPMEYTTKQIDGSKFLSQQSNM